MSSSSVWLGYEGTHKHIHTHSFSTPEVRVSTDPRKAKVSFILPNASTAIV